MTLRSMTGFGRAEGLSRGNSFTVEARSVNHRYLDVKTRLPKHLIALEASLKSVVRSFVQRGRLDLQVVLNAGVEQAHHSVVDFEVARAHLAQHRSLSEQLGVDFSCTSADLMNASGVVVQSNKVEVVELDVEDVKATIEIALDRLSQMRAREGKHLNLAIEELLKQATVHCQTLTGLVATQTSHHRDKLVVRMREAVGEIDSSNNARLMMEAGLLAERLDVQEELDRLSAHFEQFFEICKTDDEEPVGRRLDFLCQEIVREVNTTASKAQSIEITRITIELKTLMERVREQVQNVE
jgi:uncharacterized protein (TIGR00255 family)